MAARESDNMWSCSNAYLAEKAALRSDGNYRPTVLYVVSGYPWPLDRGVHIRQYHILRALVECGDVDLLVVPANGTRRYEEIEALCREVFVYPVRTPLATLFQRMKIDRCVHIVWRLCGWPLDEERHRRNELPPEILERLDTPYDVVWIERLATALRIDHPGGGNVVLDLDDIEHRKIMRGNTSIEGSILTRLWKRILSRAWRRNEVAAARKFACLVVCSENDREYLGPKAVVVPNGTDISNDVTFSPGIPGRMLYVGAMGYKPNDDAVRHFVRTTLPRIVTDLPEAHLVVVGRCPSRALRALADGTRVQVVGRVDDVRPYLSDASLSVVPLRFGGGTRLKILESLAMKTPVVSTEIGAEGLNLEAGHHISIANEPQAFADACLGLLKDQEGRRKMAEAGHERVREGYSWERISDHVTGVIARVCSEDR